MRFKSALSILSKSSPYAVSTLKASDSSIENKIKEYLFITTDIELAFKQTLKGAESDDIIFLCGSSGDGKSEILTRYCKDNEFKEGYDFHLDATHSFSPTSNAIQTLDSLFDDNITSKNALVIGINVGMLGNYAQEGAERHENIKSSIKLFLQDEVANSNHFFLDFEKFPKFVLGENGYTAEFVKELFQRLTSPSGNIIREHFELEKALTNAKNQKLCANYELLSDEAVQQTIIELLFKARLVKDQFLTARGLLDFVFHLLAGPGYLFDNLFTGSDNELASKIVDFDPANIRTQHIDKFILSRSLELPDHDFEVFVQALSLKGFNRGLKPESYLRLFYLLKGSTLANNYHLTFSDDFQQDLIKKYAEVWHLHCHFNGSDEHKSALRQYYKDIAIAAIHKYNNRNASKLGKGEFFVSEHNGYQLAADLELKAHVVKIEDDNEAKTSHFNSYFKVGKRTVKLPTNINLMSLMLRIVEGYRPNKHDKNTVVLLDELVEEIAEVANETNTLHVLSKNGRYKISNDDFDEFEVSGL